jgi:D-alanyl-D-alanine carboxypeptidase
MTAAAYVPGKGTWRGATGVDDLMAGTPMPADGAFRAGSITKQFVATVYLQLVSEGKASADDWLARWVPDFPGAAGMTMREVMSHTAGIYNYSDDLALVAQASSHPTKVWTPEELIAVAAAQPPYFAPGRGYHYSNTDYILVGLAIEKITGNPLVHELRARILDPLGLAETWFAGGNGEPDRPSLVHGYDDAGQDLTHAYDMSASWAAGAMASTGADLVRFETALEAGGLLDEARLSDMREFLGAGHYGLALMKLDAGPLGVGYGHDGLVIGYWTQAAWFPQSGIALAVLCDVFTLPSASPIAKPWNGLVAALATAAQ